MSEPPTSTYPFPTMNGQCDAYWDTLGQVTLCCVVWAANVEAKTWTPVKMQSLACLQSCAVCCLAIVVDTDSYLVLAPGSDHQGGRLAEASCVEGGWNVRLCALAFDYLYGLVLGLLWSMVPLGSRVFFAFRFTARASRCSLSAIGPPLRVLCVCQLCG